MIFLSLSFLLGSLTGCGFLPSDCEKVITVVCDECDVSDFVEDTVCECVESGEVDNAQRYYSSPGEAEIACANTQLSIRPYYLTDDQQVECRRELRILKDFGDDGCRALGYSSSGTNNGSGNEESVEEEAAE